MPSTGTNQADFIEIWSAFTAEPSSEAGDALGEATPARLLQGPFADAMTHAGQLAMLRRLAGSPVAPENFIVAAIDPANLSPAQPAPVSPDRVWNEAPPGWRPPAE